MCVFICLRRALRIGAHGFKFTDMISERGLASTRKSVDRAVKAPQIEQLCANTLLSKAIHCQVALARRDPRSGVTRQDALEGGVALNVARKKRTIEHGGNGWPVFLA